MGNLRPIDAPTKPKKKKKKQTVKANDNTTGHSPLLQRRGINDFNPIITEHELAEPQRFSDATDVRNNPPPRPTHKVRYADQPESEDEESEEEDVEQDLRNIHLELKQQREDAQPMLAAIETYRIFLHATLDYAQKQKNDTSLPFKTISMALLVKNSTREAQRELQETAIPELFDPLDDDPEVNRLVHEFTTFCMNNQRDDE